MPDPKEEKPRERIVRADRRNRGLVALGLVLITLFMAGLVLSRTVGSTTTEHTTAAPCPAGSQPACSTEQTKTTKTKNFPSESLLTVLLSSGGLLVLIGALYGRITSIKAFGAEIGLAPAETNKLVEKVTERMPGSRAEEVAEVLPAALNQARGLKESTEVARLSDQDLDAVAERAVRTARPE
jgi:hypothetical protein